MSKTQVLILGASIYQKPLIEKAKKKGYVTHVVSSRDVDPGLEIADHPYKISILDFEKIKDLIKEKNIKAVLHCASDLASLMAGKLNDWFGFPGLTYFQANSVTNKKNFVKLQKQLCLPNPKFINIKSIDDNNNINKFNSYPAIIKPVLSSGSRGVIYLRGMKEFEKRKNEIASNISTHNEMIFEEFIEGEEIGGECIYQDGKVAFLKFTKKIRNKNFIPIQHTVPNDIEDTIYNNIKQQIEDICNHLGISNTLINLDTIITSSEIPYIIDFSFRSGGNHLYELMKYKYGINTLQKMFEFSDLEKLNPIVINQSKLTYSSIILGAERNGILSSEYVESLQNYYSNFKEVIEFKLDFKVGEEVKEFKSSSDRIGNIIYSTNLM
jgi:biotin carboxylase